LFFYWLANERKSSPEEDGVEDHSSKMMSVQVIKLGRYRQKPGLGIIKKEYFGEKEMQKRR